MGVNELRDMFNLIAAPAFTCSKAFLGYERKHDTEWQKITFSGTTAAGEPFVKESALLRPGTDVNMVARDIATAMVQPKGPPT